jgi:hypothetical protein
MRHTLTLVQLSRKPRDLPAEKCVKFVLHFSVPLFLITLFALRSPAVQEISLLHRVQTGFGAHPVSGGKAARGLNLTTHLHPVPRSRKVELYLHSPICFHGMALN